MSNDWLRQTWPKLDNFLLLLLRFFFYSVIAGINHAYARDVFISPGHLIWSSADVHMSRARCDGHQSASSDWINYEILLPLFCFYFYSGREERERVIWMCANVATDSQNWQQTQTAVWPAFVFRIKLSLHQIVPSLSLIFSWFFSVSPFPRALILCLTAFTTSL